MPADLFRDLESPLARTPRQPMLAPARAPERLPPATMSDAQRHALRTAAALLCGHLRAEAAAELRQAGPFGTAALAALDAGGEPMAVRAIIMAALDAAPAGGRRG